MEDWAEIRRLHRAEGMPIKAIARHMLGLFQGLPGARAWRRHLSETMHRADAGTDVLCAAAAHVMTDQRQAA